MEYLEDAFIISKVNRYNVKGRKYIGTPLKYYFEDIGLRNARLGFRQIEETHLMENVIYNELRSRRYLGSKRYYVQSAFSMPKEEKKKQEKHPLSM